ncbi:MAG: hypothetical protein KDA45_07630 [Planctomycetales bacterium]|nr:hypothetical protein [Planctomycetales bacterium]
MMCIHALPKSHAGMLSFVGRLLCLPLVLLAPAPLAQVTVGQETVGQVAGSSPQLPLPLIAAGTPVDAPQAERWNRIVLLARPRIASGDVQALSSSIQKSVSSLVLTILATVESHPADVRPGETKPPRQFRLRELGLGYATDVQGELRVVSVAAAGQMGVNLGFVGRQMLAENERQLAAVRTVVRTSTLTMFDTRAIMLRQGRHQEMVTRHLVWLDSRSGRLGALLWLLQRPAAGEPQRLVDEPLRWVAAGTREDRAIHVDGQEFSLLGIPREQAFALQDLPPGKSIPWTDEARRLAARESYDSESLRELTVAINQALQALPRDSR